jgi:choline kinase
MINVIILAAGIGSRLRPLTDNLPKCMVPVNGVPLINRLVDQLNEFDNLKVNIVIGYQAEALQKHFDGTDTNLIYNEEYTTTNNMYSLYLAMNEVDISDGVMIINADCIYEDGILDACINSENSCIMIDTDFFNEESMKVLVEDDFIRGIAKKYTKMENTFTSIDMYKFDRYDAVQLFEQVKSIVTSGEKNSWTEVAIHEAVSSKKIDIKALPINGWKWYEIDNLEDLSNASKLFANS